jgi:hypothetical protein
VSLTATLRLLAVLGPMASIAIVVAGVATGGLALTGVATINASARSRSLVLFVRLALADAHKA